METLDQIGLNTKKAKKILTHMSQVDNPLQAENPDSKWLYKDELILCLCGIPGYEIGKLVQNLSVIQDGRKELLETILETNQRLNEHSIGTL